MTVITRQRLLLAGLAIVLPTLLAALAPFAGPKGTAEGAGTALSCSSCDARHAAFLRQMAEQKETTE